MAVIAVLMFAAGTLAGFIGATWDSWHGTKNDPMTRRLMILGVVLLFLASTTGHLYQGFQLLGDAFGT